MNPKKNIYCDLGFWGSLSACFPSVKMPTNHDESIFYQNLMDWYDLLKRSQLQFDCTVEDFESAAKEDFYLKDLWKRSVEDGNSLNFSPGAIAAMCEGASQMEFKMYNSFFLSEKDCTIQARNVGVMNVDSSNFHRHTELFKDSGPGIRNSSKSTWKEILETAKAKQNCNSMMIVDNYIFHDSEANLYAILDVLLPEKLGTVFYLTIFSCNVGEGVAFEKNKQRLEEKIHKMRPNLSIIIEVFHWSKDNFHDREIITNYIWIEIGAGFNVLKGNGVARKTTNIHITYPMIISKDRMENTDGYWNIIEDAKHGLKIQNKMSNNRLLR